jgi:Clustered mitochondria/Translation initiation factor eIF3 subunit 135
LIVGRPPHISWLSCCCSCLPAELLTSTRSPLFFLHEISLSLSLNLCISVSISLSISPFSRYSFKFAVDKEGIYGGNDAVAAKVAGHELKSLILFHNCRMPGVCLPLFCLVDYKGYRLSAASLLPINRETLCLGSDNASKAKKCRAVFDEELNERLRPAAKKLNLAQHLAGFREDTLLPVFTPFDLEGHRSVNGDDRYYLLDTSRTMPPTPPTKERPMGYLWELFRPELVKSFSVPLCSDAYSSFMKLDPDNAKHRRNVRKAFETLCSLVIPRFVKSDLLPALRHAQKAGEPLTDYRLTQAMHRRGINARYLGLVLAKVPASFQVARLLIILEALARVCKNNLRRRLRNTMRHLKVCSSISISSSHLH